MNKALAATTLLVGLTACATTRSIEQASGALDVRFRMEAPCEQVIAALAPALYRLRLQIESAETGEDCDAQIIARNPVSALSWGELVRIRVYRLNDVVQMAIRTDRVLAINVTAQGDWSRQIYEEVILRVTEPSR